MADFSALKQSIQNYIKQNGNKEITGAILQNILLSMVTTMGDGAINDNASDISDIQNEIQNIITRLNIGASYAGYATPSTTPAPLASQEVFYLATQAGTYTNFHFNGGDDPIVLTKDGIYFIVSGDDDDDWNAEPMLQLDDVPTASSNNAVKSGGVAEELALGAVYDVSAKNPTAGSNNDGKWESLSALLSDVNLNTLIPTSVRKSGMSIKFVSSIDNNYMQFRYTLEYENTTAGNAAFINTDNWAVSEDVILVENPEFVYVIFDKNKKLILGAQKNGNVYFGAGVPKQIIDYVEKKIAEVDGNISSIQAFLAGFASDTTLMQYLNETYGEYIENTEFLDVKYDKDKRLLEGNRKDGTKVFYGDVNIIGKINGVYLLQYIDDKLALKVDKETGKSLIPTQYIQESENPEFVAVLLDENGRIIEGIRQKDGKRVLYAGIPVQVENEINKISKEREVIIADYNRYNLLNNVTCVSDVVNYKCASAPNSVIDKYNATCYTIYLSSKTEYGEPSSDISVLLSVFNIAEPDKAENHLVVESAEGIVPNMVNVIDNGDYVRCLFVNMVNDTYYYRDFSKSTKEFGNIIPIGYNSGSLDLQSVTDYLESQGYSDTPTCIIMISPWSEYNGYKYGTLTTDESHPIIVRTNDNCSSIEFVGVVPDSCEWESILAIVNTRFYATIRRGDGFLYHSDDGGQTWYLDDIFDMTKIAQQRPQLISHDGELYIVHSLWEGSRGDRIWGSGRDNIIIYKYNGISIEKLKFLQNDNGIVYPNVFCFNGILYMIFSCSDLYRDIETSVTLRDRPQGKDLLYITKLFNI